MSFEIMPDLDVDFDRESNLLLSSDSTSLSSSFYSTDFSELGHSEQRRRSIVSCGNSSSPELLLTPSASTASPITPSLPDQSTSDYGHHYVRPVVYLDGCHSIYQLQYEDDRHSMWMKSNIPMLGYMAADESSSFPTAPTSIYMPTRQALCLAATDPALTKSIFASSTLGMPASAIDQDIHPWTAADMAMPAETIAPSVTFQPMLASSPSYKLEPSTPQRSCKFSSAVLSSSPVSLLSPKVVPSQRDLDHPCYPTFERTPRLKLPKRSRSKSDRLQRRSYTQKHSSDRSTKSKSSPSKSGVNCELVIAQNEFACSYAGCIDKSTGKQKRFKRQEHKKRHEKTVHGREAPYKCWVPECNRPFTRTDNLKSHLRNTHSKQPGVRGNRYVATLDQNSEFYNPSWEGDLDKHGYPLSK